MPNDDLDSMKAELADLREFRKATEKRLYLLETAMKKAPEPVPLTAEKEMEPVQQPQPVAVEEELAIEPETEGKPSKDKPAK